MALPIYIGAEGSAELQARPIAGVRRATQDEEREHSRQHASIARADGTGRPYWLWFVGKDAPAAIQARARQYVRVVRL